MINKFLIDKVKENFKFQMTEEQEIALNAMVDFFCSSGTGELFLLKGYAGTGKTSLIGALVKTLFQLEQKVVLLAPTGRAAKVFSYYSGTIAYTIHKKIYRQRSFSNEMDNFSLNDNLHQNTLFIVDEASMIANDNTQGVKFGSGCLLDDLIQYVYSVSGCKLLLIGDSAQLPPVGEIESLALSKDWLEGYGLNVRDVELTQVVRQNETSGILYNATHLRQLLLTEDCFHFLDFKVSGFADISYLSGDGLIEALDNSYGKVGMDETIVICRSNKRANLYNRGIRNTILYRDEELNSGDYLLVAKNNYYWTEGNKNISFIANGDIAVVKRVRKVREQYGFHFADVLLNFPDYDDWELDATVLLDTLSSDAPALTKEENDRLFYTVIEDYADIPRKADRMKKMKQDIYYNALQIKYAYAMTCHKAQGGQWKHVYIDFGYLTEDMLNPDFFRWLYTAFTRATEHLYLVNWPKNKVNA